MQATIETKQKAKGAEPQSLAFVFPLIKQKTLPLVQGFYLSVYLALYIKAGKGTPSQGLRS